MNFIISIFKNKKIAQNAFVAILCLKICAYLLYLVMGGGGWFPLNDANDYHAVAQGRVVDDARTWGHFLKYLNDIGLYDRTVIGSLIFICNCIVMPWLLYMAIWNGRESIKAENWWLIAAISAYPTLTFFSLDIYKDLPMVLLFLAAICIVKRMIASSAKVLSINYFKYLMCLLIILVLIYPLRFYLALSIVVALFGCVIFNNSKRLVSFFFLFNLSLIILNEMGAFDWLKYEFRPSQVKAGSAYGIDFNDGYFLFNFWLSFAANIYGIYMFGLAAKLLFLLESVPAIILSGYLWINRQYIDRFITFLIVFFLVYSAAWVVGIDVLGTAVRYRVFNYLVLIMGFATLIEIKKSSRRNVN